MSSSNPITEYGFTAVQASATKLLSSSTPRSSARTPFIPVSETPVPDTPLAKRIQAYAKAHLPEPTYNHSMRVYHYGLAMKKYRFPEWKFTDETYYLTCLLHDIGTTDKNLRKTKMSFEFYGGLLALDVLQTDGEAVVAPKEQAESIAEAIIRHQDLCEVGTITVVGQLIQLATIFDNTGGHADLVHPSAIENVTKAFPRLGWSNCFAATIRREIDLKRWAHTTALGAEKFPSDVQKNKLMAPYE